MPRLAFELLDCPGGRPVGPLIFDRFKTDDVFAHRFHAQNWGLDKQLYTAGLHALPPELA
jgi:hypothetical protein